MDLNADTISKYIARTYPTSCLAFNIANTPYTPSIADCIDFFWYEKLKFCGCGNKHGAMTLIKRYLQACKLAAHPETIINGDHEKAMQKIFGCDRVSDNVLAQLVAYAIDGAKLTEHGYSIDHCWLTEEGETFLWCLEHADLETQEG